MKQEVFLQEIVVGVGLFGGLWIAAGVNRESEIAKGLLDVVESIDPSLTVLRRPVLLSLAFGSTVPALLGAYTFGKRAGMAALFVGYFARSTAENRFK